MEVPATTLSSAIDALTPPDPKDAVVLRAEKRQSDNGGVYYERVIRFADPVDGAGVQQSLRLVEAGGKVYAFNFSAPGPDFNDGYRLYSQVIGQFVAQKQSGNASW